MTRYDTARTVVEILRDGRLDIDAAVALVEQHVPAYALTALSVALEVLEAGARYDRDWDTAHIMNADREIRIRRADDLGKHIARNASAAALANLRHVVMDGSGWCSLHQLPDNPFRPCNVCLAECGERPMAEADCA